MDAIVDTVNSVSGLPSTTTFLLGILIGLCFGVAAGWAVRKRLREQGLELVDTKKKPAEKE